MKQDVKTPGAVPQVLLRAKAEADAAKAGQVSASSSYEKGPWDKGHWANRK